MDLLKKLNPLYLKEQNTGNQQKQQNQQSQQGNLGSSGLATSQNMEVESKNPQHIDLLSQINMQNFQNQNQFPNFNQMENQMEKNIQQLEEENKDQFTQKQKGQDQDQLNEQNSEEQDEQKNKDQIGQDNDQLNNEQTYEQQQQKNLQHNQQDMLKKQAQKEGKNVSFSVKNLTENFRVLYSQFYKDYSSVGEQYYNQSKNKYYSILGNLVLASLNQVQIFQVIYFDEEEGSKLRYLCEFDVEGEIQGIQVLPVAGSRIKNYLILQLQKDKLSVVLLDNNRDLMFKTVNMYNFDNKIVHQKVDIKGKSGKEKNILRIQQVQENFAPIMVATTAANRDILVILMTKQIQFPKNVEKYKDYRLKFNPDFFDSWAIQEEGKQDPTRLFGPSIYISLKKDFGVQNLVDFVFDQVGIIKTDLKSQRIFILDYRVIQEEKQDINTLLMQNQNMGEFQSTENVRIYNCCCLVKVNILTLFMKQQSQDSVLKNVSKFNSEDALGRVLSNLPSDCFKMLQIKYGGILIFSRFMIFLYQEEYQKLIVLPLIPLEELRKLSYDLSLLESSNINMISFKKQFDNFENGIFQSEITVLDENYISIVGQNNQVYLLTIYYGARNMIDKINFECTKIDSIQSQIQTACSMNFIHSDLSYLYFVGHKFLDYTLNILKINECRNIEQGEKRVQLEQGQEKQRNKNFEFIQIAKLNNFSSIQDFTGNKDQFYAVIGGQQNKRLFGFRDKLKMKVNEYFQDGFQQFNSVDKIFTVDSSNFLISMLKGGTICFKIRQNQIESNDNALFITEESTQETCLQIFLLKEQNNQQQQQQQQQQGQNVVRNKKDFKWQLFVQACQKTLRIIDLQNKKYKDLKIDCGVITKMEIGFNHIFIKGNKQNLCIRVHFTEKNVESIQFDVQTLEKKLGITDIQGIMTDFSLFQVIIHKSQEKGRRFRHIAVTYLKDFVEIYELTISSINLELKSKIVFKSNHIKEGIAILRNELDKKNEKITESQKILQSISDLTCLDIDLAYKWSKFVYISEVCFHSFKESLIVIMKTNDGDLYIYKGVLVNYADFTYEFVRFKIQIDKFLPQAPNNSKEAVIQDINQDLEELQLRKTISSLKKSYSEVDEQKLQNKFYTQLKNQYENDIENTQKRSCHILSLDNKSKIKYMLILNQKPLALFVKNNQIFVHNMNVELENYNNVCQLQLNNSSKTIFVDNNCLKIYDYFSLTSEYDYYNVMPCYQIDNLPWNWNQDEMKNNLLKISQVELMSKDNLMRKAQEKLKSQNLSLLEKQKLLQFQEEDTLFILGQHYKSDKENQFPKYECGILKNYYNDESKMAKEFSYKKLVKDEQKQGFQEFQEFYEFVYRVKAFPNILSEWGDYNQSLIGILSYQTQEGQESTLECSLQVFAYNETSQNLYQIFIIKSKPLQSSGDNLILDFTILNPQDDKKLMCVLAEKDKISVYDLEISKNTAMLLPDLQKNTHIIPSLLYQIPHEKSIITNIKALKKSRLLMLGDANFGFEMFSVGQGGAQGKHRGHRLFIRELEMFEFNGKMKILAVDENMNLYFYSLLQGDKCEKIADLHLPSRISKLIGRSENQKTQVKFWAGFLDGNIREINMAQHQKIRFLQVFQDIIFEELPFYAGMHPQEIRSIQNYKADNTMKARQGIADLKFLDTLFNMSRPLQKVFYNKTLQGREGIVSFIKDTLEQKK